jgi:chromosome condensin MukBEF ATPase and DNA-binding subunit MukB
MDTGILVATLTPDEEAKINELNARRERIEAALWNARHKVKKARQKVGLFKHQLKIVNGLLWPLERIRFPEL